MLQYRKFSAALKSEVREAPAPKVPKPPKAEPAAEDTLGALAALGGVGPETANSRFPDPDPEERAAVIAEGAGVPRAWAEGYAALAAMPPSSGFWPERWQRIIDATGAFLDRWAGEMLRCGWSNLDVFGCDPGAPAARFDCMGLVLLLDRCEVEAIDRDGADLVMVTGERQRFRRRPLPPGTVSLWQLARR